MCQNIARFRVNAFNQNRGAGAVFRAIPSEVLTMEDLGMGQVFSRYLAVTPGFWCWSLAPQVRESPLRLQRWLITSTTTDTTIF